MADDRAQRNRERFPRFSAWLEREIRVFDAGAKVRWVVEDGKTAGRVPPEELPHV